MLFIVYSMISSCQKQLEAVSRDRDRLVEQLQQGAILFERQLQSEQHKCKGIYSHLIPQYNLWDAVFFTTIIFSCLHCNCIGELSRIS